MIQYVLRLAKRMAVLLPGIIIAYFSVRDIFPYFDRRLPLGLAIIATYGLGAYVLLPALVRLFRLLRPVDHLPLYCVTPDGFASDPLNIGIVGTRRELILAMEGAGWRQADRHNLKNLIRMIICIAFEQPYPTAPMSSLYLFGRKQDIAFEIPTGPSPTSRHHVRFWSTPENDALLWVGAASLDEGLSFIRHNFQISHMIAPDTNAERDLIVKQLRAARLVQKVEIRNLGEPYRMINRVLRGSLHTDGRMAIITLKPRKILRNSKDRHTHSHNR